MKRIGILFVFLALAIFVTESQASIVAGDVAVVEYSADNPDTFSFVALTDLSAGDTFGFTDNGWLSGGGFRGGEGNQVFTVGAGGIAAGAVTTVDVTGPSFSTSGDQLFLFTGNTSASYGTLLFGLQMNGDWDPDATSSNTSADPGSLASNLKLAISPEVDNAAYDASNGTTGTPAELLALISNPDNWTTNSSGGVTPPSGFTVVPEPTTFVMFGSLILGGLGFRRRK